MKKIFVSPVAEIIATESVEMIAASVIGISENTVSGSEGSVVEAGARNAGRAGQVTTGLNVEALDF